MSCEPGCSDCCGPAPVSPWEAERLGIAGAVATPVHPGTTRCAFHVDGGCSVYERRPYICRLYGTTLAAPCPRGRGPRNGPMSMAEAIRLTKEFGEGCPPGWDRARQETVRRVVERDGTRQDREALELSQALARSTDDG